jgi:phosphoribosyl-ATP pyrophosphohydrolase
MYYALFIFVATLAGYILGGVGWLILGQLKEELYDVLVLVRDREKPASSDTERGLQQARQRAIEECAEEAYELVIENEAATAADHDRAERAAARLREAILALVEKGEHGS